MQLDGSRVCVYRILFEVLHFSYFFLSLWSCGWWRTAASESTRQTCYHAVLRRRGEKSTDRPGLWSTQQRDFFSVTGSNQVALWRVGGEHIRPTEGVTLLQKVTLQTNYIKVERFLLTPFFSPFSWTVSCTQIWHPCRKKTAQNCLASRNQSAWPAALGENSFGLRFISTAKSGKKWSVLPTISHGRSIYPAGIHRILQIPPPKL